MLPDFLFSTYKQYKTDTDKIATWLAETAKKCGYKNDGNGGISPDSGNTAQGTKTPKLKGRARKLARDAAAAEKMAATTAPNGKEKVEERKYALPVSEFEAMAEHIAKSRGTSLKIPNGFIKLMKRCIKTRRGTSDWFQSNDTDEDPDGSTSRHLHFVDVLQRTLQALIPMDELQAEETNAREKTSAPLVASGIGAEENNIDLVNAFSLLKVDEEEGEDEDLDAMTAVVPADSAGTTKVQQKVRYVVEADEDDDDEWFFALHCFFSDMHELRIFLAYLWTIYKNGEIDLSTTAVTTNAAYDLMRRAEDDFHKGMQIPKEYKSYSDGDITELYYIDCCVRAGEIPKRPEGKIGAKLVDTENWSIVQESFILPFRLLTSFNARDPENGHQRIPVTRPAWVGNYDPTLDRNKANADRLCEQDEALLADFLTTVGPYVMQADTPSDDELMTGIRKMLEKDKIPLWLIFACQNFLDIHSVLKDEADRPLGDLQHFARDAQGTLKEHFAFFDEHSQTGYRSKHSEDHVRQIQKEIVDWGLRDRITQILSKQKQIRKNPNKIRTWQPNELLKMHPLLCGMMKYSFQLQLQWEGITLINETLIMSAAHLYNALKQCNYLPDDCEWEDMELLLHLHSPQDVFFGAYPTTIEDCTKRLALYQGVSPQTFAKNRRKNGGPRVIYSKNGGNYLKPNSPIAGVFRNRFLSGADVDLSITSVEVLLGRRLEERQRKQEKLREYLQSKDINWARMNAATSGQAHEALDITESKEEEQTKGMPSASKLTEGQESGAGDEAREQRSLDLEKVHEEFAEDILKESDNSAIIRWQKHRQLSVFQFLEELSEGLRDESPQLLFDYFGFHRRTSRFLEALQAATLPILKRKLDEQTYETMAASQEGVHIIPGLLMHMACDPRNAMNMSALKDWVDPDDTGLKAAAVVMREFIAREGAAEVAREEEVLTRYPERAEDDGEAAERRAALDAIESIRAATGAVPVAEEEEAGEVRGTREHQLELERAAARLLSN